MPDHELESMISAPPALGHSAILRAMAAVMAEVERVRKDRKGPGYKFTGHNDVTEVLRDSFVENGIVETFTTRDVRLSEFGLIMTVSVRWTAVSDGSYRECEVPGICEPILNKDGKNVRPMDLGVGVALSYAIKYAQMKTFMLLQGDVPDAETGRSVQQAPEPREERRPKPKGDPVSGEQIELMVSEYNAISNQADLGKLRVAVSGIVNRLDEDSPEYIRLREADERASLRVAESAKKKE